MEEVRKKGNQIKIGDKEYQLSEISPRENQINEELKKCRN